MNDIKIPQDDLNFLISMYSGVKTSHIQKELTAIINIAYADGFRAGLASQMVSQAESA